MGLRLVQRFEIARGRSSELDKTGTGTAVAYTMDQDGVLDPTNLSSPFLGNLYPMKQAKIEIVNAWKALHHADSTMYPLFRGFVDTWGPFEVDPSGRFITGQVQMVDGLDLLAELRMMPGMGDTPPVGSEGDVYFGGGPNGYSAGTDVQVDDRIKQILALLGWPTALQDVFTGNVKVLEQVYARADQALSALDDACDAEFPFVANRFIGKDGVFNFRGRFARFRPDVAEYGIHHWFLGGLAQAQADSRYVPISQLPDFHVAAKDLVNAALALPSGVSDTDVPGNLVVDAASADAFGYRSRDTADLLTYKGHDEDGTYNVSAVDETEKFADYRVGNYKDPKTRLGQIVIVGRDPRDQFAEKLWDFLCRVDLSDLITLTTTHPGGGGFDDDFFVESIRYECEPAPPPKYYEITCTIEVSPRALFDHNPFGDVDAGVP